MALLEFLKRVGADTIQKAHAIELNEGAGLAGRYGPPREIVKSETGVGWVENIITI